MRPWTALTDRGHHSSRHGPGVRHCRVWSRRDPGSGRALGSCGQRGADGPEWPAECRTPKRARLRAWIVELDRGPGAAVPPRRRHRTASGQGDDDRGPGRTRSGTQPSAA